MHKQEGNRILLLGEQCREVDLKHLPVVFDVNFEVRE